MAHRQISWWRTPAPRRLIIIMTGNSDRATRDFLIQHAGMTEAELTFAALHASDAELAASRAGAYQQALATSWDVGGVAVFLGLEPASVRQAVAGGMLYASGPELD